MEIQLLDCTLRDGGYINDWRFGKSAVICILERLIQANVDVIEVGFLDERHTAGYRQLQQNIKWY